MTVALLGAEATGALLSGRGRITLVNRTPEDAGVTIVAAAIVRHRDGGAPQTDIVYQLDLGAALSVEVEAAPPLAEPPDAIEIVLRVRIEGERLVDAYCVAHRADEDTSGRVEAGIKVNGGTLVDGEEMVPDFPKLVIYTRTQE